MGITTEFNPKKDGWTFENWGEVDHSIHPGNDLPWDLFRETYLGVNPTHSWIEAPLDCTFYEIFKNCADKGNCGGMSMLALALFKYGGYMGYCAPACFYSGVDWPDSPELHRVINNLQARQFSAHGIEHFVEVCDANNLNNAVAAYERVKEGLGKGDYALLSIANDSIGEYAHTVIPYKVEQRGGTRILHIWDPNFSADNNPNRYPSANAELVITSAFNWVYNGSYTYNGAGGGWCFAIPISKVLPKARHPMTLDMLFSELMTLFVSGPGCAVSQISDESGARFYRLDADTHLKRLEIETDPARRLKSAGRWPWFAERSGNQPPGELYFLRRRVGNNQLNLVIRGTEYSVKTCLAGNLVELQVRSDQRATDHLSISRLGTTGQTLEIKTDGMKRQVAVRQLRNWRTAGEWRSIQVNDLQLPVEGLTIHALGDLQSLDISGHERELEFEVHLEQRFSSQHTSRLAGRFTTGRDKGIHIEPQNWVELEKTRISHSSFNRK